jgi:signal transduction histidine kinase
LSNAVKFSPDGTTISLRAGPIPHGKVRFEVIDRGWGIHPDDMSRIFEKFGRGRALGVDHAGPVPGVGLGLYLSHRIVRASGSELNVASDPGRETRFWFDLERIP